MYRKFIFRIKAFLCSPYFLLFLIFDKKGILTKDLRQWEAVLPVIKQKSTYLAFIRMFAIYKEYRNLFLYRCGITGDIIKALTPCMKNLYITTNKEKLGEGLVLQHAFSTIIWAEEIGKNCQVWQNVTIGRARNKEGRPTIGDNVRICTGAIVVGDIKIGNNVTIGAGTVLTKSVPDNCVVCGNPARVVKENGIRVNKAL